MAIIEINPVLRFKLLNTNYIFKSTVTNIYFCIKFLISKEAL